MARYLLDTTALVDYSKRFEPTTSRLRRWMADGEEVGVCPVTISKLFAGLPPTAHETWHDFVDALRFWPISRSASVQAGIWRYEFARRGMQLTTADTLVAAVAREAEAVVVTGNVRDYPMNVALLDPRT